MRNLSLEFQQKLFTIGVYGTTEGSFFQALVDHGITHFVDIRSRRGLRGTQYIYANGGALEKRLNELGIRYEHFGIFAPTDEIRDIQRQADKVAGVSQKERRGLDPEYVRQYELEQLRFIHVESVLNHFPAHASLAFFCVEQYPESCHRSLLAQKIASDTNLTWKDITPQVESE